MILHKQCFYKIMIFMLLYCFVSCSAKDEIKHRKVISKQVVDSTLINANQYLKRSEEQLIDEFIMRYHWEMQKCTDGLRFWVYKKSKGIKAENKMLATLEYTLSLINGDTCYTSKELGPKRFEIGKYEKESGLNEGVLMMRMGEKAKFIIPSHLGFGLMGDGNKVPKKATLIYDVELINLQK